MKTILCLLILFVSKAYSQLELSNPYNDAILYQTNEVDKASLNCEFGFCKTKVVENEGVVVWMVLPECDKGEEELSKEKLKK
jgi:hypothetical protein